MLPLKLWFVTGFIPMEKIKWNVNAGIKISKQKPKFANGYKMYTDITYTGEKLSSI